VPSTTSLLSRKRRQARMSRYARPALARTESVDSATHGVGVEPSRETADRISLEQRPLALRLCGPRDKIRAEDRPPELVVGGFVDEDVLLAGEEPGQRSRGEVVATLPQQIGRGTAHHQVELELGVPVPVRTDVSDSVPDDAAVQPAGNAEVVVEHRKK
jgi:hypothetical protein